MLNIFIFCTGENIFHPRMFDEILIRHSASVVGAAIFPGVKQYESPIETLRYCLRIDGPMVLPRLAKIWLSNRIKTLPHCRTVDAVFAHHGIKLDYFRSPNSKKCIEKIKHLEVDIIFNNQPRYLKNNILTAPRMGCLNRHTSLLPAYRGVEPVFHALLNMEKVIGVTIHSMELEIDAGEIYSQTSFPPLSSVWACYQTAFSKSASLFNEALGNLESGDALKHIRADETPYFKKPTEEEIKRFRSLGLRYI